MPPSPTRTRGRATPRRTIAPADEKILAALSRYHRLTAVQVARLLYSPNSLKHVRLRLRGLLDAGAVQRSYVPTLKGKPTALFSLSRRGHNHLATLGHPAPGRFRPGEAQAGYLHATHARQINDFLVDLERWLAVWPEVTGWELVHERELKRRPIHAPGAAGEDLLLVPDAWVVLTYRSGRRRCVALEVDRGTEGQAVWRRKVRAYLAYHGAAYPEHYPETPLTIVVVVTPSQKRCDALVRWTALELEVLGQRRRGHLFRLRHLVPGQDAPQAVFLAPRWRRPFDDRQLALWPHQKASGGVRRG